MKAMVIISERELDIVALGHRYLDVGDVSIHESALTFQNDECWFRIEVTDTARSLAEFEPDEKIRLFALVGQPYFAGLPYSNSASVNLAVSRLPSEGIFIDNDCGVVFTVREIQRRIKAGEEWERFGEEFFYGVE